MQKFYISCIVFIVLLFSSLQAETKLGKRKPFSIPLPHMSCSFDSGGSVSVFVAYEGAQEGWEVSSGNDRYVKDTKKFRKDHIYRELPSQASFISMYEAGVLADVSSRLIQTLGILEKDLKQRRWDRCLFLDAYFPNFMERFYYLFGAAVSNLNVMPKIALVNDTLYDNSENSSKSDQRINTWKSDTSYTMKLRIVTKELAYQLEQWRTNVLLNPERDLWDNKTEQLIEVYELFICIYFNLPQKS